MGNVHALQASVGRTAACAAQAYAETIVKAAATGANAQRRVDWMEAGCGAFAGTGSGVRTVASAGRARLGQNAAQSVG